MRRVALILSGMGIIVFIAGLIFKDIVVARMSLQTLGALLYTLGLFFFTTERKEAELAPEKLMTTAIYATLWVYSLVTAISGNVEEITLVLAVIFMTFHSMLIILKEKDKLNTAAYWLFSTLVLLFSMLILILL